MTHEEPADDSQLTAKREILVRISARRLSETQMITYSEDSGKMTVTDLGRIAARYYIRYRSIEIFNKELRPVMSEADILGVVSQSTEVSAGVTYIFANECPVRPNSTP